MKLFYKFYIKLIKNFTLKKILYLILIILFSPLLIFIVLIRPIVLIRFGNADCDRIGRAKSVEVYLLHKKYGKKENKSFDIWVTGKSPLCNEQLLIMVRRKLLVIEHLFIFVKILQILSKYVDTYSQHLINSNNFNYDREGFLEKYPTQLKLTKKEIQDGELILKQFGIPKKAKIICLVNRDRAYLKETEPLKNFSLHDYRDTDINNYIPAVKTLIKNNFYVVRLGKFAEKRLNIKNSKFIDYPFHPLKSDFMDFFFVHRCYFHIGANTGLDCLAEIFRKPILIWNMVPLNSLSMNRTKKLLTCKKHINSRNQKLSLRKIFDCGAADIVHSEGFKKKQIKLIQLSPTECKESVIDMLKLMRDSWKIKNKKNLELQRKFRELYLNKLREYNFLHLHDRYEKIISTYGISFLKKNYWFLK